MCYGMGCSHEQFSTGTCTDPRRCAIAEQAREEETRARRIASLRATPYLCPDCDERGKAAHLKQDGSLYLCPKCRTEYDAAALLDAYQGMHDDLISDAEWAAARMEELKAAHPVLAEKTTEPESPAQAAPRKAA